MSANARHSALVEELRQRLRQMDHSRTPSARTGVLSSTGIPPLDPLLPPGTFRAGMIIEWVVEGAGAGAARMALPAAMQALQNGGALVVIDERREFYPPAAVCLGLDLDRTIVIRPRHSQETIWALEQSLHCAGVAATLAWIDSLSDRVFRRLQLAAEHGAGLGIFLRPAAARCEPTWADIRWGVQPVRGVAEGGRRREESSSIQADSVYRRLGDVLCEAAFPLGRRVRVELLHCRGGTGGGAVTLEISDETGAVSVAPPLAPAANLPRAARA
ncbi:MAG: ImuA family protein [Deltaproteobacteria bacterium]